MAGDQYYVPAKNTVRVGRWEVGPGHVVWGPVRFVDEPGMAKDRPVLLVGRQPGAFLVLTLSSRPKRADQHEWFPLSAGPWDRQRRPSWVRLHPWYVLPDREIRRPGGVVDRGEFDALRRVLATKYHWAFPNG